jgi:hypothetical protein
MATREQRIENLKVTLERMKMDPGINPYSIIKLERDIDRLVKFTQVTIDMQIADIKEEMSYLLPVIDEQHMQFLVTKLENLQAIKNLPKQ